MTTTKLSQQEADNFMKSLDMNEKYYRNFYDAFHEERKQMFDRNQVWALSENERAYYRIESYLFGINFQNPTLASISSFARILHATPSHNCAACLKFLIQETLLPLCIAQNKHHISAALTQKGKIVFEELKKSLPGIEIMFGQPYHFATMTCGEDHL